MKKTDYRAILGKLPIMNPTPEDMALVCPHLTKEQAVAAFHNTEHSGYVACPALRIRGACQLVSFHDEWTNEKTGEVHPPRLSHAFAKRTRESYTDGGTHGDIFYESLPSAEAIKFAEENWGEELILDSWVDALSVIVQDPTELRLGVNLYSTGVGEYPTTKAVLGVCLNRKLNVIINEHHKPGSVLFDDAIAEITLDPFVWDELKGGRGISTHFNCAYCGDGLGLTCCPGCGHLFDDDQYRCGDMGPLTPKMIKALVEHGHMFKKDPQIALDREAGQFEECLKYRKEHQKV